MDSVRVRVQLTPGGESVPPTAAADGNVAFVPFRAAAYYAVLNQVARHLADREAGASFSDADEEEAYDFDDGFSEDDDDYDGASDDGGDDFAGAGREGFLLSDLAQMGGMQAMYGDTGDDDSNGNDDDDAAVFGEDNEDDQRDASVGRGQELPDVLAKGIRASGQHPSMRAAMRMLPRQRQELLQRYMVTTAAGVASK